LASGHTVDTLSLEGFLPLYSLPCLVSAGTKRPSDLAQALAKVKLGATKDSLYL